MSYIGIDLGTSFIKGAVLDLETRALQQVQRIPFPRALKCESPLLCEFDPSEILSAVQTLIAGLALHASECEGLVMCSQMHGMVLMNERGEARSNFLSWRDQRAMMPHPSGRGSYYDLVLQRISRAQQRQLGNELDPGRPLCFLFWFREQGKLTPGLIPVSLPDFVLSTLCNSYPGVETTNASAYGAFNLETMDWHHEVIGQVGLGDLCWPAVRKPGEVVGHLNIHSEHVPCYTPVGDYQCALAGALFNEEEISLNIATGAQVSRMIPWLSLGNYQTRPFFDGKFVNTFTGLPGGRALDVIVELLSELATAQNVTLRDPWAAIVRAVNEVRDTDLEVELGFFPNLLGDRGRIANIRGDNFTLGHLFLGAFKNMASCCYDAAVRLWPEKSWKKIVFSGGLVGKMEVLRRAMQEKFGTGSRVTPFAEDTLFGLLILATVFSGRATSIQELTEQIRRSYTEENSNAG
jgi:sugar (pentulose or hexulose) kinase